MKLNVLNCRTDEHLATAQSVLCYVQQGKNECFDVPRPTFLFTPSVIMRQYVTWLERKFDVCQSLAAFTYLSSIVSQLFEPQVQKIDVFTYRRPHFCFPWRRPCDYDPICCMDGRTIRCLQIVPQNVPIYLQQFTSYSNHKCKK